MPGKKTDKPVIAVDLDDVLGDENGAMRQFINQQYGFDHTIEDYTIEATYFGYWEQVWGVDSEEGSRRYEAFVASAYKRERLPVLPGAIKALNILEKKYQLVVITSRREDMVEYTHDWLTSHFPDMFSDVHFTHAWDEMTEKATKAKICDEIGASYLIDDNLEHCALAAGVGVEALLFGEYGWNKNRKLPQGVHRVADWKAVLEYFDARS